MNSQTHVGGVPPPRDRAYLAQRGVRAPRLRGIATYAAGALAVAAAAWFTWPRPASLAPRAIDHRPHARPIAKQPRPAPSASPQIATNVGRPDPAPPANPFAERDAGYAAIAELQSKGQFDQAAIYALAAPPTLRRDLVIAAFHDWARQQPESALTAATQIADSTARELAIQSVLSGWSRRDPAGLAELALQFPMGTLRDAALTKALRAWMHADPWAAGDWIMSHDPHVVATAEAMFQIDQR